MLIDGTGGIPGNDNLGMLVSLTPFNDLMNQFVRFDFLAGIMSVIEEIALESMHDQIALTLDKTTSTSNEITASFAYVDGRSFGATTPFAAKDIIFDGDNFTRAQFFAATPVPTPATLPLFVLALGLMFFSVRRNLKKQA